MLSDIFIYRKRISTSVGLPLYRGISQRSNQCERCVCERCTRNEYDIGEAATEKLLLLYIIVIANANRKTKTKYIR